MIRANKDQNHPPIYISSSGVPVYGKNKKARKSQEAQTKWKKSFIPIYFHTQIGC
jgi:hypothetical protein